MRKREYIAKYGWWRSIFVAFLSLTFVALFALAKVDEVEPWVWLLAIVVLLNGIFLFLDYQRRDEVLCINSDGIYVEKKERIALPWNQVKKCHYVFSFRTWKSGWYWDVIHWQLSGIFIFQVILVVERKHGAEERIRLNPFRFSWRKIADYINEYSGKQLFDWQKTKSVIGWGIMWVIVAFLIFIAIFVRMKA